MSYKPGWRGGRWSAICDRCGFRFHSDKIKTEWTGLKVCPRCFETRNPQDFLRLHPEKVVPPWTRPEPEDGFANVCDPCTSSPYAGVAAAGCAMVTSNPLSREFLNCNFHCGIETPVEEETNPIDFLAYWDCLSFSEPTDDGYISEQVSGDYPITMQLQEFCTIVDAGGSHGNCLKLRSFSSGTPSAIEADALNYPLETRSTAFDFGNQSFSIGRWFKLDTGNQLDGTARLLLGRWHSNGAVDQSSYMLYFKTHAPEPPAGPRVAFAISSDGTAATSVIVDGYSGVDWLFLVGVHDAVNNLIHLWINGVLVGSAAWSGGAYSGSDAYFSFDYRHGDTYAPTGDNDVVAKVTLNQYIMSAFVMDRVITEEEILRLYNSGTRMLYADTQL